MTDSGGVVDGAEAAAVSAEESGGAVSEQAEVATAAAEPTPEERVDQSLKSVITQHLLATRTQLRQAIAALEEAPKHLAMARAQLAHVEVRLVEAGHKDAEPPKDLQPEWLAQQAAIEAERKARSEAGIVEDAQRTEELARKAAEQGGAAPAAP